MISFVRDENLHIPTHPANTGGEYCGILNPVLIHSNSQKSQKIIFRKLVYTRKNLKVLQKSVTVWEHQCLLKEWPALEVTVKAFCNEQVSEGLTHQCSRQSCLFSCQSSKRGASEGHGGTLVLPCSTMECPVHPSPFRQGGDLSTRCWKAPRKYYSLNRTKAANQQLLGCSLCRTTHTQPQVDTLQRLESDFPSPDLHPHSAAVP